MNSELGSSNLSAARVMQSFHHRANRLPESVAARLRQAKAAVEANGPK